MIIYINQCMWHVNRKCHMLNMLRFLQMQHVAVSILHFEPLISTKYVTWNSKTFTCWQWDAVNWSPISKSPKIARAPLSLKQIILVYQTCLTATTPASRWRTPTRKFPHLPPIYIIKLNIKLLYLNFDFHIKYNK